MICDSSTIYKLSTPQNNNTLRRFQTFNKFFSKLWWIVNCSLLLIGQMHFSAFELIKIAFEFNRESYTFTCLCQGNCESPTIYNQALKESLRSLEDNTRKSTFTMCWRFNDLCSNWRMLWKWFCSFTKTSKYRKNIRQAWKTAVCKSKSLIVRACDHSWGQIPLPL